MARPKRNVVTTTETTDGITGGEEFFTGWPKETREAFIRRIAEHILLTSVSVGTNYKMGDLAQHAVNHATSLADLLGME